MSDRKKYKNLTAAMRRYRGALPKEVQRVAKQYGYKSGCIVPGCNLPARIHHIVPRRLGGTNALENLMPICYKHEAAIHAACKKYEQIKRAERYREKARVRVERTRFVNNESRTSP